MPVETANFIEELVPSWPTGTDPKNEGDNHMRTTKAAILGSFPNMDGPWKTTNKIKAGGADMSGAAVQNLGDPVAVTDAVNQRTLANRVPGFIQWGAVGSDGSFGNSRGSGDWYAVRVGSGRYRITFTREATGGGSFNQGLVITPINSTDDITARTAPQPDGKTIDVVLDRDGVARDYAWSFIRIVA